MGSAVDQTNIRKLLIDYHQKGIGGVEIAPIYGAKGFEDRYISYLSPQWIEILQFTVHIADSLGMQVDLTQGTGWPYGGPWVEPANAASKLVTRIYHLNPGDRINEPLSPEDHRQANARLEAVIGRPKGGQWVDLSSHIVEGRLNWEANEISWEVIAYFNGKTGQRVKRAAPGGEGFVLDHLSRTAVDSYLGVYDSVFGANMPGIRALYNDSYEVYGADWTPDFLNEFETRRGYDLTPHLFNLFSDSSSDTVVRIKSDYRETLHELLLENFTRNWTDWAHDRGKLTKNQAHGSPGHLLDLYAAVDIPESETFGSTYFPIPGLRRDSNDIRNVDPDPIMLKFASSAAHVSGKNLVSSETFTWLGEHFKSSFSQMKPELEQAFLSGVNHMFYHGVTYSPEDAAWPGWLFYASLNLTPANSLWPHFNDFNRYVTRCQSMLQNGWSDNELLVYWPVYDVWADPGNALHMLTVHNIDEWLHPTSFYKWTKRLMKEGYLMDFVSDQQIQNSEASAEGIQTVPGPSRYKTLIIPSSRFFTVGTLESILNLASDGAQIIFEQPPSDVPGYYEMSRRRTELQNMWNQLTFATDTKNGGEVQIAKWGEGEILVSPDLATGLDYLNIHREELVTSGLEFVRRKTHHSTDYFLVNHTANLVDTFLSFNAGGETVLLLDPLTGHGGLVNSEKVNGQSKVRIQLQSGQSLFVRFLSDPDTPASTTDRWAYRTFPGSGVEVDEPWTVTFTGGGPELPVPTKLDRLISWAELDDSRAEFYSGSAMYESSFHVPEAGRYVLSLGEIRESARIWINGTEVGYVWSIPYEIDISRYVQSGQNTIRIEVVNLMANRIRYLDQEGISWRNYHEINFVNIDYQPFDASQWDPVPSGLIGPVRLIRY